MHFQDQEQVPRSPALRLHGLAAPVDGRKQEQLDGDCAPSRAGSRAPEPPAQTLGHVGASAWQPRSRRARCLHIMSGSGSRHPLGKSWQRLRRSGTLDAQNARHLGHSEAHLPEWHPACSEVAGPVQRSVGARREWPSQGACRKGGCHPPRREPPSPTRPHAWPGASQSPRLLTLVRRTDWIRPGKAKLALQPGPDASETGGASAGA